jgi:signal peptidase II
MNRMSRLGWTALALALAVIVVDQATKYWILDVLRLQEGQSIAVVGPLHLTGVRNAGVSFGFLQAHANPVRWALTVFSVIVAVLLAGWVRRSQRPLFAVALGLVMGGAIGNVIDRVRFGSVTDFIDASRLYFPWIFNVADSAITIGICLLLVDMLRQDSDERAGGAPGQAPRDAA